MGTYFPTSNNQRDASSTMLYLRDPLPGSYSESTPPVLQGNMMMYMNFSSTSAPYSDAVGVSDNPNSTTSQQEVLLNFGGSRTADDHHHLDTWKDGRNEMLLMGGNSGIIQGQGLSLSLGTNVQSAMQMQFQNDGSMLNGHSSNISFHQDEDTSYQTKQTRDNDNNNNDYTLSGVPGSNSYGGMMPPSIGRGVPNSKYFKAAQELLDEVVNVRKAIKEQNAKKELAKDSKEMDGREAGDGGGGASSGTPKASGSSASELSVAEKQELQNKMTKLLSMLEEVDRRYRQYYHQMQIVVSSFDVVAGSGAAKPYTALALQTISRHFRCLRDAINGQIHVARKSLGEEDSSLNDKGVGISRLRYVDQQLKQQRALQQLGMMQNHAWRPQRGLPETSVSILRAWLFEHFLHPYPKDSDKIMLARQTGLTRSQVSNWFINARVRLWKPMVEEMYKEEAGDAADVDSNSSSETITRALKTNTKASEDTGEDFQQPATSTGRPFESKSNHMSEMEMMGPEQNAIFQNEPHQTDYGLGRTREGQKQTNDVSFFNDTILQSNFGSDRFMNATADYQMTGMERFGNVSGISLTLGLQQCEGGNLGMDDGTQHHGFIPMRGADVYNTAAGYSYGD